MKEECLNSDDNYTTLLLLKNARLPDGQGKKPMVTRSLKEMEEILSNILIRVHVFIW